MNHIFFHNDADGFYSAFLMHEHAVVGYTEFHTASYNVPLDFSNVEAYDKVFFVDFTPKLEDAVKLSELGISKLVVIDHHPVAQLHEQIAEAISDRVDCNLILNIGAKGAVAVVAEYCGVHCPEIIRHIGCRDVWDFAEDRTKPVFEVTMLLNPLPSNPDEEGIYKFFGRAKSLCEQSIVALVDIGGNILEKQKEEIKADMRNSIYVEELGGKDLNMHVAFSTRHISELGNVMAEEAESKVACVAQLQEDGIRLSFRSIAGATKTARDYALEFGGGGHPHAAGAFLQCNVAEVLKGIQKSVAVKFEEGK